LLRRYSSASSICQYSHFDAAQYTVQQFASLSLSWQEENIMQSAMNAI